MHRAEVVIIGAGVAGGALAIALARNGISVALLEKTLVYQDRAQGEFLVPWGVEEAAKIGLLDILLRAGGHYTPISVPYDETIAPKLARTRALNLANLLPGVQGAMTFSYPRLCQTLAESARAGGVSLLRGVSDVIVTPGNRPSVSFTFNLKRHTLTPRLIVGADGRGSASARGIGATIDVGPLHHLLAGLSVDAADAWPNQEFCIGTERDIAFYILPQGGGRVRLYVCYGLNQRRRFAGPHKVKRFLEAFRLSSIPDSQLLACARPVGDCYSYPNAETCINMPIAPGVVLIGDAAGHNDPTIGQGLSIAFRDARLVLERMLRTRHWSTDSFALYVEERRERMRRLRIIAQQTSMLRVEFTDEARIRRRRALDRIPADPSLGVALTAIMKGPFRIPAHSLDAAEWDRLVS